MEKDTVFMDNHRALHGLLEKIDGNRTSLRERVKPQPVHQKKVDDYCRILNTFTSNAIEGNSFTLLETKLWLDDGITVEGKTRNELFEVDGHGKAFDYMLDTARGTTLDGIGDRLLEITSRLHKYFFELISPKDAGVYRTCGIMIVGSDRTFPEPETVGEHMGRFREAFLEYKDRSHPVVLAAFAHLRLVLIHPFVDGNGRISRLLMNLVLVNQGYQIINFDIGTRKRYYEALKKIDARETDCDEFFRLIAELELDAQEKHMDAIGFRPGESEETAQEKGKPVRKPGSRPDRP